MGVTQVWQNEAKFFFLTNGPVLGGRLEKPAEEEAAARRYAPRVHRLGGRILAKRTQSIKPAFPG